MKFDATYEVEIGRGKGERRWFLPLLLSLRSSRRRQSVPAAAGLATSAWLSDPILCELWIMAFP